jgi:ATP-dependent RNA helicase SUPV3L1/SUV3
MIKGESVLKPKVLLLASEQLNGPALESIQNRVGKWMNDQIEGRLKPLVKLSTLPLEGALRGIAFQVSEALGAMPRYKLADQIRNLEKKDYGRLKFGGLRVGYEHVFLPILLKPDPTELRCLLWGIFEEREILPGPPPAGRVSFEAEKSLPHDYYLTAGYAVLDGLAVRLDMLDRLAGMLRRASRGLLEPSKEQPKPAPDKPKQVADTAETTETPVAETAVTDFVAETPTEEAAASETATDVPAKETKDTVTTDNQIASEIKEIAEATDTSEESKPVDAATEPEEKTETDAAGTDDAVVKVEETPKPTDDKRKAPANLAFAPTHEMLSLVGTTREQFTIILDKLGYDAFGEGDDLQYKRKSFHKRRRPNTNKPHAKQGKGNANKGGKKPSQHRKPAPKQKEIDPDSPFAILKDLTRR